MDRDTPHWSVAIFHPLSFPVAISYLSYFASGIVSLVEPSSVYELHQFIGKTDAEHLPFAAPANLSGCWAGLDAFVWRCQGVANSGP
jgi:hypothetical protein